MDESWSNLAKVVYKRTYARHEDNKLENWEDTVKRVIKGNIDLVDKKFLLPNEEQRLFDLIFNRKATPAGRGLWFSGAKAFNRYSGRALVNCWFITPDDWQNFVTAYDLLMLGGGVGMSVEHKFVSKLPRVKSNINIEHIYRKDADLIVPDSRQGFEELLSRVLFSYFVDGKSFTYSTVCIRPEGEPIKGFGGKAAGPKPLIQMVKDICNLLNTRSNKHMRPIDAADLLCIIGQMVVAGNVRRCLPKDSVIHLKNGLKLIQNICIGDMALTTSGYRKVTNIFKQGKQELIKIKTQDGIFKCTKNHKMAVLTNIDKYEWKMAKDLKKGDRLITTRESIEGCEQKLPLWNYIKPKHSTTCVDIKIPNLDEDISWFIGLFQGDGYTYVNNSKNGFNAYVSLVFQSNELNIANKAKQQLERFGTNVVLKKRKNENSYIVRSQSKQLAIYFDKYIKSPNKTINIPEFIKNSPKNIRLSYLAGLLDSDGTANNRPVVGVKTCYEKFQKQVQQLYYSCGLETRLYKTKKNLASRPNNWKVLYNVNLISNHTKKSINKFSLKEIKISNGTQRSNSFPGKWIKKYPWNANISVEKYEEKTGKNILLNPVEVEDVCYTKEIEETYDIEVEDKHEFFCNGYLTHNSAILIQGDCWDKEYLKCKRWDLGIIPSYRAMANFSVVCDDIEDLHPTFWKTFEHGEAIGIVNLKNVQKFGRMGEKKKDTAIGMNPCAEACLEAFEPCNLLEIYLPNLKDENEFMEAARLMFRYGKRVTLADYKNEKINEVIKKNRRVGIGITGCLQSKLFNEETLNKVYKAIQEEDRKYSKQLGINQSIRTTVVKPSGTLSLLGECTAGIHPAHSKYMIRRVRFSANDSLIPLLKEAGHNIEPVKNLDGTVDNRTLVVDFYLKYPDNTPSVNEGFGLFEQLEIIKMAQKNWADQSVSCTAKYKKEQISEIKKWLSENLKYLKTISFMQYSGHGFEQAPEEEITEEQYIKLIEKIKPIQFDLIQNGDTSLENFECDGGVCPVK